MKLRCSREVPCFLKENDVLDVCQSTYRPRSEETALLRIPIYNDVSQSNEAVQGVLLMFRNLTATFDTINHDILLQRLRGYGICREGHAWVSSYIIQSYAGSIIGPEVCNVMMRR